MMFVAPYVHFVITIGIVLLGLLVGAAVGGSIGFGITVHKDYKDDGKVFNRSIDWNTYVGYTLGGIIAREGIGLSSVLGSAAGTAALVGSSATLFTTEGMGITVGSEMALGTASAFVIGMAG